MQESSSSFRISKKWFRWKVDIEDKISESKIPLDKRLRIGVVGGGDMGIKHASSVRAAPAATLAGVCDINPEVLWDLANEFKVPAIPEYEKLLVRKDMDAVLLCLPHFMHAPFAEQAAQAGKHVLLEKPLGVNLKDATRIIEACSKAGVRLTVNFSFRYRPAIELMKQLIHDEVLGKICGLQINFYDFKGASFWAGGFTARASGDWRASKEKAGGGPLILSLSHHIDYLRYCTGLEVKRIFSNYGTYATPVEVEDAIVVISQYNNGAIGSITATTFWRATGQDEVRIWGNQGALTMNSDPVDGSQRLRLWSSRRWKNLSPGKEHHLSLFRNVDFTSKWINRFALAVAKNEVHEITGKDGWINNAVIEAAYNSWEKGRPVEIESYPWEDIQ